MFVKFASILFIAALVFSIPAEAGKRRVRRKPASSPIATPTAPTCDDAPAAGAHSMVIPQFTGYAPSLGGINGSCNGGASKHLGFRACENSLQAFLKGTSNFIHVGAQQQGGSAELFGCWAKTTDAFTARGIPNAREKSCHVMAIVDHYARSESEGRKGVNGKVNGTKMDVEVSKLDSNYKALGIRRNGNVSCVRRVAGMQNRDKTAPRKIRRRHPQA